MGNVFIVELSEWYEGGSLLKAFSTKEKATHHATMLMHDNKWESVFDALSDQYKYAVNAYICHTSAQNIIVYELEID